MNLRSAAKWNLVKSVTSLLGLLLISTPASAEVWKVTRQWTDATEIEYAQWFAKNVTADFFRNPNKILGGKVKVDCAKAAYVIRAVFAAEKGLPYKYMTTKGKDKNGKITEGKLIDQEQVDFKSTDAQANLIRFLNGVAASTSTLSTDTNSFPIAITKQAVTPGVIYEFSVPHDKSKIGSNHLMSVKGVTPAGAINWIWATVPAETRLLTERIDFPHFMPVDPDLKNNWGFRRFYQPQDYDRQLALQALIKQHGAQSPEAIAANQEFIASLARRGFNNKDQYNLAKAALDIYRTNLAKYAQANNIPMDGIDLQNLNFNFKIPVAKGVRNARTSMLPPLAQSSNAGLNANVEDPMDAKVSFIFGYQMELALRLGNGNPETPTDRALRDHWNLCYYAIERQSFVEEDYNYFFHIAHIVSAPYAFNRCPTPDEDENYTTPNRDAEFRHWYMETKNWYFAPISEGSRITHRDMLHRENITDYEMYELIFNNKNPHLDAEQIARTKKRLDNEPIDIGGTQQCVLQVPLHDKANTILTLHIWEVAAILDKADEVDQKAMETKQDLPDVISSSSFTPIERRWGLRPATKQEAAIEAKPECEKRAATTAAAGGNQ